MLFLSEAKNKQKKVKTMLQRLAVIAVLLVSVASGQVKTAGLPGVDLHVTGQRAELVSVKPILAAQVIWTNADHTTEVESWMNWHERVDPVALATVTTPVAQVIDIPATSAKIAVALDAVIFSDGRIIGPDTKKLQAAVEAKWRAERDIVFAFHDHPAASSLTDRAWTKDPDPEYQIWARAFQDELNRVAVRRGIPAAIECAAQRISEAHDGPSVIVREGK